MVIDTQTRPEAQSARAVIDEEILDEIFRGLDLAISYLISMKEACRRGDRKELSIRRRQVSTSIKHAFEAHTMLGAGQ